MRAQIKGIRKVASSRETPIGPIHGFDVYLDDARIGWYRSQAPWRGYAFYAPNGGYGTVATARQAIEALIELSGVK